MAPSASEILRALAASERKAAEAKATELERQASELESRGADMVDHRNSQLGARRQCEIVRRRIERGQGGAAIVGRRHLLSREAITEELEKLSEKKRNRVTQPKATDQLVDLRARYGLEKKSA